ncbi:MAG: ABC transporter permease [Oscillospiraceae bacterium]|jgi:simple sugar transport system permease protein|nr:ABC transporter permease [Oscillospiraceae bacterium]
MTQILSLIQSAIIFGTVIMFGALGEILTEKSGNLNLGVPGIMSLGAIGSLMGAFWYEQYTASPSPALCLIISFVTAMLFSLAGGLIYSFITITLRANQNVTGLTLTIFGCGFANFFGGSLNKLAGGVGQISLPVTSKAYRAVIPFLSNIPIIKNIGWLVYVGIILAFVLQHWLFRSRSGLNLRAVGENPATADAAGINVIKYKYLSTCAGAMISGIGGLFYIMDYIKGTWASDGGIEALGWLAVALVIFATWRPRSAIWGSYLFGLLSWMYYYIGGLTRSTSELFKTLPYVVTIAVLIFVSLRRKKENLGPSALGLSYFREER